MTLIQESGKDPLSKLSQDDLDELHAKYVDNPLNTEKATELEAVRAEYKRRGIDPDTGEPMEAAS